MDYDERDSSASESGDDMVLDTRTVELALRSLSPSPLTIPSPCRHILLVYSRESDCDEG